MPVSLARAAAFDILLRVDTEDAYASELLHSTRVDKLSSAEAEKVEERFTQVNEIVQWTISSGDGSLQ